MNVKAAAQNASADVVVPVKKVFGQKLSGDAFIDVLRVVRVMDFCIDFVGGVVDVIIAHGDKEAFGLVNVFRAYWVLRVFAFGGFFC